MKQYNPAKSIKRGYKLWARADMSGYIYQFEVYQGKAFKSNNDSKRYGLGGSVVKHLTESLKMKNFIIYMDNYFTSPELFEYLKSVGIYACGTIRLNCKNLPQLCKDKDLKRGEFDF